MFWVGGVHDRSACPSVPVQESVKLEIVLTVTDSDPEMGAGPDHESSFRQVAKSVEAHARSTVRGQVPVSGDPLSVSVCAKAGLQTNSNDRTYFN